MLDSEPRDEMEFKDFDAMLRHYFPENWVTVREEVRHAGHTHEGQSVYERAFMAGLEAGRREGAETALNPAIVLAALDAILGEWTLHPRAEASVMKLRIRKLREQVASRALPTEAGLPNGSRPAADHLSVITGTGTPE